MATLPTSLAAMIDSTGISAADFPTTLAWWQEKFRSIYGADIYIEPDSQDGQFIAVLAQAFYDMNQMAIAVYRSQSPSTAQADALSSTVKINGIRRSVPSKSSVVVKLSGTVGTPISNGVIEDSSKQLWILPPEVVIPAAGEVTVTAIAQLPGVIVAPAGTVTKINTPVLGWQSVTNASDATPGNPVETDSHLRQRQRNSTSLPAQTPLEAIIANVAEINGIGRYAIYDNDTALTDTNGVPGHSIAVVVEGGDVTQIAQTIEAKKSPGTGTYGTTSIVVTDPAGVPVTTSFFVMTPVAIKVQAKISAMTRYVATTSSKIVNSVAAFIGGFEIGQDSLLGKLFGAANLYGDAATTSSGLTQQQLDILSNTYNLPITGLYQGRADMVVIGGPYTTGAVSINVQNFTNLSLGKAILVAQSDGSQLSAVITARSGSTVTFTPAIGAGKTIANGAQVLVNDDLQLAFNEGATCSPSDVVITT